MTDNQHQLIVLITHGLDDERSSVGFTIANGAITAGQKVSVFLTSSAVDLVRKGGADLIQCHPLEPLAGLIQNFMERGGTVWACTPCVKSRGYEQADLLDNTIITGASPMLSALAEGASSLSF